MGYAAEGYQRALLRLEAALDLALSGSDAEGEDVRRQLGAARAELGRSGETTDATWARALARRITADPGLSRTSQKTRADIALKTLLND